MRIDPRIQSYFAEVSQVFLYVTDECDASCRQCLYKPLLRDARHFDPSVALRVLEVFKSLGAYKLTFIGGEPTMYDRANGNENLLRVISGVRRQGYEYIRLDTNGSFDPELLERVEFADLDELCFSFDGPDAATNDSVRGAGRFNTALANLRVAIRRGYKVQITTCVHKELVANRGGILPAVQEMAEFAAREGVDRLNLHPLFKVGAARDDWTEDTSISPWDWVEAYPLLSQATDEGELPVHVRVPLRFVDSSTYAESATNLNYCPVRMGERALLHPDGTIRVCAFTIGTDRRVGYWTPDALEWEQDCNELSTVTDCSTCPNQSSTPSGLVPLCMSFKPRQDETVWNRLVASDAVSPAGVR